MVSVTESTPSLSPHHPVLKQAPVKALDPDGVGIIGVGTAGFAVALIVMWTMWATLAATGNLWRFWVAVAGTALGLIGLLFRLLSGRRRRARQSATPNLE